MQNMLVKYIEDKKECWEDYLDSCVFTYNTSKHESSKFTPYEVTFGRRALLPIELGTPDNSLLMELNDELVGKTCSVKRRFLNLSRRI